MVRILIARGIGTLFLGLAITGCARGIFIGGPCDSAQRESVNTNAASALYLTSMESRLVTEPNS